MYTHTQICIKTYKNTHESNINTYGNNESSSESLENLTFIKNFCKQNTILISLCLLKAALKNSM